MSNDPIHIWWSLGSWLFGVSFSRREIGLSFGPLSISIIPSLFGDQP